MPGGTCVLYLHASGVSSRWLYGSRGFHQGTALLSVRSLLLPLLLLLLPRGKEGRLSVSAALDPLLLNLKRGEGDREGVDIFLSFSRVFALYLSPKCCSLQFYFHRETRTEAKHTVSWSGEYIQTSQSTTSRRQHRYTNYAHIPQLISAVTSTQANKLYSLGIHKTSLTKYLASTKTRAQ